MEIARSRVGASQVCVRVTRGRDPYGQLQHLLDVVASEIESGGDIAGAIQVLTDGLREIKGQVSSADWMCAMIPAARAHPVSALIEQCPLTHHAQSRPRGYPGDAELLDLIYRHEAARPRYAEASATGRGIYDVTVAVSACESVRQRRRIAAAKIDDICSKTAQPRVLSVACGHLREADLSHALQDQRTTTLVAVDQDPLSLSVVEHCAKTSSARIVPRRLTVRDLMLGRHDLEGFDFIYAVGLYDYLQAPTAARLSRRLFGLLNSEGTLLLANFLKGIWEAPYMEAYMDWHLIYRGEDEIRAFLSEIPFAELASETYWPDAAGCIGYLEAVRR